MVALWPTNSRHYPASVVRPRVPTWDGSKGRAISFELNGDGSAPLE